MNTLKERINFRYIGTLVMSIAIALLIGAVFMLATGFNPIEGYAAMLEGALGTTRYIGNTLERAMTLCLLGLACALGARGGLFNVGGEGQLFFGALAATMVGLWCSSLPGPIVILLSLISAVVVGGFYAWIPAMLKVKLGVSEVITTIMMNNIAIKVCTYLVNGPWGSSSSAVSKGTDYLPETLRFNDLIKSSNLSTGFISGIALAIFIWYLMKKTTVGLQIKITGENERFSKFSGLPNHKLMVGAMVASGAICGLVGMLLVYGYQGHMTETVSNEYYFDGLLVAMIMNYNPIGIIIMSLFFAIMSTGATMMDVMVGISTQLYDILFSIIIFLMAAEKGISAWTQQRAVQKAAKAKARKEIEENVGTDSRTV